MSEALTPGQASALIVNRLRALEAETCSLRDCAGRVLRQVVVAERANPPFDRVCMDGIAVSSAGVTGGRRRFRIQATQAAGAPPLRLAAPDDAIEVMTGAVLPSGTDCVIPLEEYALTGTEAVLRAEATASVGRNVQRRGSHSVPGAPLLGEGTSLGAAEIAVVASAGLAAVQVTRQPRLMVVSNGDELIEPGLPIADHQIRRSNAYAITAALQAHGYASVNDTHLGDDPAVMQRRIKTCLDAHDVLVLSGGVSEGRFDYVPTVLRQLGVEQVFHHVAQQPGRPLWFGVGPEGQAVFGLPGNPVATLTALTRYVLPALRVLTGAAPRVIERVALATPLRPRRTTYFMPVVHVREGASAGWVTPRAPQGSGDFLALAGTDGFVELPPRTHDYEPGCVVDFYRW